MRSPRRLHRFRLVGAGAGAVAAFAAALAPACATTSVGDDAASRSPRRADSVCSWTAEALAPDADGAVTVAIPADCRTGDTAYRLSVEVIGGGDLRAEVTGKDIEAFTAALHGEVTDAAAGDVVLDVALFDTPGGPTPTTTTTEPSPPSTTEPAPSPSAPPTLPPDDLVPAACEGVDLPVDADIQAAVDSHPEGTTFCLAAGTYRGRAVKPKAGDKFIGKGATETVLDGDGVALPAFDFGADDVTIQGLEIVNYDPVGVRGAINSDDNRDASQGWQVLFNHVHDNSGAGVSVGAGSLVKGNEIHANGQYGIHGGRDGTRFAYNEIYDNNTSHADPGWDAGGSKIVEGDGVVVDHNWIHDNFGVGLWFDINNRNAEIHHNLIEDNTWDGIMWEISYNVVIHDNVVRGNGKSRTEDWVLGANIFVQTAGPAEVRDNWVSDGRFGITVVRQERGSDWTSDGFDAHGNTICMQQGATGYAHDFDGGDFSMSWDGNHYFTDGGEAWRTNGAAGWDAWRSAGHDPAGTLAPLADCPPPPFDATDVGPAAL